MSKKTNPLQPSAMTVLLEYLVFKKFIMPFTFQLLFWAGIGGTLFGTWWLYSHGNWSWIMSLVFGTLATRLIFESFLIKYRTYVILKEINEKLSEKY